MESFWSMVIRSRWQVGIHFRPMKCRQRWELFFFENVPKMWVKGVLIVNLHRCDPSFRRDSCRRGLNASQLMQSRGLFRPASDREHGRLRVDETSRVLGDEMTVCRTTVSLLPINICVRKWERSRGRMKTGENEWCGDIGVNDERKMLRRRDNLLVLRTDNDVDKTRGFSEKDAHFALCASAVVPTRNYNHAICKDEFEKYIREAMKCI